MSPGNISAWRPRYEGNPATVAWAKLCGMARQATVRPAIKSVNKSLRLYCKIHDVMGMRFCIHPAPQQDLGRFLDHQLCVFVGCPSPPTMIWGTSFFPCFVCISHGETEWTALMGSRGFDSDLIAEEISGALQITFQLFQAPLTTAPYRICTHSCI